MIPLYVSKKAGLKKAGLFVLPRQVDHACEQDYNGSELLIQSYCYAGGVEK